MAALIGTYNKIDGATLSGGSWVPSLPLSNIQTRILGQVARTTDDARESTTFSIDLGLPKRVNVAALVNHNMSLGARYRLRGTNDGALTNMLRHSEHFDHADWSKTNCRVIRTSAVTAPNGKKSALKVIRDTTSSSKKLRTSFFGIADNALRTFSVYAYPGECSEVMLQVNAFSNHYANVEFNLITKTVVDSRAIGNATSLSYGIEDAPGGWLRLWITCIPNSLGVDSTGDHDIFILKDGVYGTPGNDIDGLYLWGAMLNTGNLTAYCPSNATFVSRSSVATYWDSNGVLQTADVNVPRVSYDPSDLTIEPFPMFESLATNSLRNNTMQGALPNLSRPDRWDSAWYGSALGVSTSVVNVGVEDGIEFIDVKIQGTYTGESGTWIQPAMGLSTDTPVSAGEVWAFSCFLRIVEGDLGGCDLNLRQDEVGQMTAMTPALNVSALPLKNQRFTFARELVSPAVAYLMPRLRIGLINGQEYNFTLRIGLPQLERDRVTSLIKTTNAAVTRATEFTGLDNTRPAGYMDDWQPYGYSSDWQDVWPSVYDSAQMDWEQDNWWDAKYSSEETTGYTATLCHVIPETAPICQRWRVDIDDTANNAGYIQIGRMFIGPAWKPERDIEVGVNVGWETNTSVQKALNGSKYYQRRNPYRVTKFSFNALTEDEAMGQAFEIDRRTGIDGEVMWIENDQDTIHALRRRFLGTLRELSPIEFPYAGIGRKGYVIEEVV
ncbi:MAG: phage head spike fiber domain-containing protein [Halobacteriota archaeon]